MVVERTLPREAFTAVVAVEWSFGIGTNCCPANTTARTTTGATAASTTTASTATVASATTAAATMRLSVLSVRSLVGKLLSALCARVLLLLLAHYGAVTTLMT